jgi:hypothetical protein
MPPAAPIHLTTSSGRSGVFPTRPSRSADGTQADRVEHLRREINFDEPDRALPQHVDARHGAEFNRLQQEFADRQHSHDTTRATRSLDQ